MTPSIRYVIEFTIAEGKLDAVNTLLAEAVDTVQAHDSGALSYEFFLSDDERRFYALEWYKDSAAAIAHGGVVGDVFTKLLKVSRITRFEVFGNPSAELVQELTPLGAQFFTHWQGFTR